MRSREPAAFLSYVHADDQHEGGLISQFRERLSAEVRMQIGQDFPIFHDRTDIAWGQHWQARIDETLDTVTLLIPVMTPGFFASAVCREEITRFLARERRLGRSDLILPVYYVSAPQLNDSALREADPLAIALFARQYADWRELRFEPLTAPVVRRALSKLAVRMRETFWLPSPQESQREQLNHEESKHLHLQSQTELMRRLEMRGRSNPEAIRPAMPARQGARGNKRTTGVKTIKARSRVNSVAVHSNNKWVAVGGFDGAATLWDISTGAEVQRARVFTNSLAYSVAFSPDGRLLAVGDQGVGAQIVEVPSGRRVVCVHKGQPWLKDRDWDLVWSVAFSSDGRFLGTGGRDGTARIWEVSTGRETAVFSHPGDVLCVAIGGNDHLLATGCRESTVARIWDINTRTVKHELHHQETVYAVAFSPDGSLLATGSYDKTARLWSTSTGEQITLVQHEDTVKSVAFAPVRSNVWATGSRDTTAKVLEYPSGVELRQINHEESVTSVAFSPDGQLLVTGCDEKVVRAWCIYA
ncbi:MAG: TIR domain-containing protein [Actinomycetota bacterium]|nr:TIR domain-containing protein [Actinomycetota bacterium]